VRGLLERSRCAAGVLRVKVVLTFVSRPPPRDERGPASLLSDIVWSCALLVAVFFAVIIVRRQLPHRGPFRHVSGSELAESITSLFVNLPHVPCAGFAFLL